MPALLGAEERPGLEACDVCIFGKKIEEIKDWVETVFPELQGLC